MKEMTNNKLSEITDNKLSETTNKNLLEITNNKLLEITNNKLLESIEEKLRNYTLIHDLENLYEVMLSLRTNTLYDLFTNSDENTDRRTINIQNGNELYLCGTWDINKDKRIVPNISFESKLDKKNDSLNDALNNCAMMFYEINTPNGKLSSLIVLENLAYRIKRINSLEKVERELCKNKNNKEFIEIKDYCYKYRRDVNTVNFRYERVERVLTYIKNGCLCSNMEEYVYGDYGIMNIKMKLDVGIEVVGRCIRKLKNNLEY